MRANLTLSLLLISLQLLAQPRVDSLQNAIQGKYGKEKLILLHMLTQEYFDGNDTRKALKTARQATALAENILVTENELISDDDMKLRSTTYFMMGKALYKRKQFSYAKTYFQNTIKSSLSLLVTDHIADSEGFIAKIESRAPDEKKFWSKLKALEHGVSDQIISSSSSINLTTTLKLAKGYEARENYPKAIEKYEKAINLLKDKGNGEEVNRLNQHIALLKAKENGSDLVASKDESSGELARTDVDSLSIVADRSNDDNTVEPETITNTGTLLVPSKQATPDNETDRLRDLATRFEESENFEQSLSYYKLYIESQEKLREEELNRELALLEQSNELENRAKTITLLEQEKELQDLKLSRNNEELAKQVAFRNNLIVGAILIAGLAIALYLLYTNKRKAHSKLTVAYSDLDKTQQKLSQAQRKIQTLLKQQVSGAVAEELLTEGTDSKISQKFVCIMFLDIRGFTPFAEKRSPEEIIQYQNDVFGFMIEIIERHHGIINQFLGDGFMATFGAPTSSGNDCENAYQAAREIVDRLEEYNQEAKIPPTKIGIGLHAGPVVAGNVGTDDRKQYSITGNTVILASRIEQLNKQFNTQLIISQDVYDHLQSPNGFGEQYEDVMVKGRSEPIRIMKVS